MYQRVRYTVNDVSNNRFYQMPKFLFEGEFKALSNNARVLYTLLRDRPDLIYAKNNLANMVGVSLLVLNKAIEQLKEFGLIDDELKEDR